MKANQALFPVSRMCKVLGVSPSGYEGWLKRGPSARVIVNQARAKNIVSIHAASRGTYGVPRATAELREIGHRVGRGRVRHLMRAHGIQEVSRRRWRKTAVRDRGDLAAPDLVERSFEADGPTELWVADIPYVPTWSGFLFLAVVIDAWSRRVVGWAMANHLRTDLVLDALSMADQQRRPKGVIEAFYNPDGGTRPLAMWRRTRTRAGTVRPEAVKPEKRPRNWANSNADGDAVHRTKKKAPRQLSGRFR